MSQQPLNNMSLPWSTHSVFMASHPPCLAYTKTLRIKTQARNGRRDLLHTYLTLLMHLEGMLNPHSQAFTSLISILVWILCTNWTWKSLFTGNLRWVQFHHRVCLFLGLIYVHAHSLSWLSFFPLYLSQISISFFSYLSQSLLLLV